VRIGDLLPLIDDRPTEVSAWAKEAVSRHIPTIDGAIRDLGYGSMPLWWVPLGEFELWASDVERFLGRSLGRRLSSAAAHAESLRKVEETRFGALGYLSAKRRQNARMAVELTSWRARGIGSFTIIDSGPDGASIEIENAAHGALCAGIVLASYERIVNSPNLHRHLWTDLGDGRVSVRIERDGVNTPPPQRILDHLGLSTPIEKRGDETGRPHPLSHAKEIRGAVTLDGVRFAGIDAECFASYRASASRMAGQESATADSMPAEAWNWEGGGSEAHQRFSSAVAEATRVAFLHSESLVIANGPSDWLGIGSSHLSTRGLGAIISASSTDGLGISLRCSSPIDDALLSGTLSACWERVEGRRAKVTTTRENDAVEVRLEPLHEVAVSV